MSDGGNGGDGGTVVVGVSVVFVWRRRRASGTCSAAPKAILYDTATLLHDAWIRSPVRL